MPKEQACLKSHEASLAASSSAKEEGQKFQALCVCIHTPAGALHNFGDTFSPGSPRGRGLTTAQLLAPPAQDQGWLSSLPSEFIRFEFIFKPASTPATLIFHEPTVPLPHFLPDSRRNKRQSDHHGPSGGSRGSAPSPGRGAIVNTGRAGHSDRQSSSHGPTGPEAPRTGVKPAGKCP